ncbi:glutarate dioxygenase GlaH [Neptunomonas sp.]|jgi:protein CsiD|uniref:glutarate dioxygenase GlaH n=1 Tax=Neptunomonas sp. TaxID=1971898 RepID=UPI0025FCFB72|nr:glutarate dioxygenase GlaH [Neptunomonas sp.]
MTALLRAVESPLVPVGFTVEPHAASQRLQVVTLSSDVIQGFADVMAQWPVQALEYKPFLRYATADRLDELTENTLGRCLNAIMQNRDTAAFLLQYDGEPNIEAGELRTEFEIKLSTAISHLIGMPNHDSMYGKYYARFTVLNEDNSDSYLRQAHRRMELHTDGTYVNERTDFVLMQKLGEAHMEGGESLLLHLDDWADLNKFYNHPLAKKDLVWGAPKSKNVESKVTHPIFFEEDKNGKPHMSFIDQFVEPQNMSEGLYLYQMGESIEADPNYIAVPLPVGSMLVAQNHCWLHGRDKFTAHPQLSRELLRQRGHFTR